MSPYAYPCTASSPEIPYPYTRLLKEICQLLGVHKFIHHADLRAWALFQREEMDVLGGEWFVIVRHGMQHQLYGDILQL